MYYLAYGNKPNVDRKRLLQDSQNSGVHILDNKKLISLSWDQLEKMYTDKRYHFTAKCNDFILRHNQKKRRQKLEEAFMEHTYKLYNLFSRFSIFTHFTKPVNIYVRNAYIDWSYPPAFYYPHHKQRLANICISIDTKNAYNDHFPNVTNRFLYFFVHEATHAYLTSYFHFLPLFFWEEVFADMITSLLHKQAYSATDSVQKRTIGIRSFLSTRPRQIPYSSTDFSAGIYRAILGEYILTKFGLEKFMLLLPALKKEIALGEDPPTKTEFKDKKKLLRSRRFIDSFLFKHIGKNLENLMIYLRKCGAYSEPYYGYISVPDNVVKTFIIKGKKETVVFRYFYNYDSPPIIVARGRNLVAKAMLPEKKVPIIRDDSLAHALFHKHQVGDELKLSFYEPVAVHLALLYDKGELKI